MRLYVLLHQQIATEQFKEKVSELRQRIRYLVMLKTQRNVMSVLGHSDPLALQQSLRALVSSSAAAQDDGQQQQQVKRAPSSLTCESADTVSVRQSGQYAMGRLIAQDPLCRCRQSASATAAACARSHKRCCPAG